MINNILASIRSRSTNTIERHLTFEDSLSPKGKNDKDIVDTI